MSVALYFDHQVARAIVAGLRERGVDVLTAAEDSAERLADEDLLDRATHLERALFTHDQDFLRIAGDRQSGHVRFAGIIRPGSRRGWTVYHRTGTRRPQLGDFRPREPGGVLAASPDQYPRR